MFNLRIINGAQIGDLEFHITMALADAFLQTEALHLAMRFSLFPKRQVLERGLLKNHIRLSRDIQGFGD